MLWGSPKGEFGLPIEASRESVPWLNNEQILFFLGLVAVGLFVPLQSVSSDLQVGRLFRYFGSCWDQGTGEDPTNP